MHKLILRTIFAFSVATLATVAFADSSTGSHHATARVMIRIVIPPKHNYPLISSSPKEWQQISGDTLVSP